MLFADLVPHAGAVFNSRRSRNTGGDNGSKKVGRYILSAVDVLHFHVSHIKACSPNHGASVSPLIVMKLRPTVEMIYDKWTTNFSLDGFFR